MANFLQWMSLWCLAFALFASITSFSKRHSYPKNVRVWTGSDKIWQGISAVTILVGAISMFEIYQSAFGSGGGTSGGDAL
uniref:Uncharacterized protein n=1 Tax=viral metagenome TaxID=1070528 RepID=A0A6C0C232_9ZZZZ